MRFFKLCTTDIDNWLIGEELARKIHISVADEPEECLTFTRLQVLDKLWISKAKCQFHEAVNQRKSTAWVIKSDQAHLVL